MKNTKIDKIELLSPAGDMECLIAAVQNGANAVYFGANKFNARANSINFDDEQLKLAIDYAKLRNVKTHLTLNILIKNNEFEDALKLVQQAYSLGIDGIIVQDLGLVSKIKQRFPDLELHASTQTTTYNIEGVNAMAKLGFDRVVLARELTIQEITDICKNTDKEIEIFIHGALCISYSGQCLMSSIIGGRSGNRGKCAGTCRMPYELIQKENGISVEKGYLLSSKDVCTLDILPELIMSGVKSFKIEGRMKSPEYVGVVTKIYRKYIDLYFSGNEYIVTPEDRKTLLQIFNRGGFSTGYLKGKLGKDMMYTKKPSHIGVELGKVVSYNLKKGHVNIRLSDIVELGDSIGIQDSSCKISELMINNENIKTANVGQVVTIGRIKGNIQVGDIVYKTVNDKLIKNIDEINKQENIKRDIDINVVLKLNEKIRIEARDRQSNILESINSETIVQEAKTIGITKERIIEQINKTGNTVFNVNNICVDMENNVFVPISSINEVRRLVLEKLESSVINSFRRKNKELKIDESIKKEFVQLTKKISILLNTLNPKYDYTKIKGISSIYVPFRFFVDEKYKDTLKNICDKFDTYIYLPSITKSKYVDIFMKNLSKFNIKGAVISNLSQIELIKNCIEIANLVLVANYTLNIFNDYTIDLLNKYGFSKITISPEMNKSDIKQLNNNVEKEIIVYGRTLLMTCEYCVIGKNGNCDGLCTKGEYILKDRLGYMFPIYTDKVNCNSLIYNSKITSIECKDLNVDSIRIDILDEDVEQINEIVKVHFTQNKMEGIQYTNGNFNKEI